MSNIFASGTLVDDGLRTAATRRENVAWINDAEDAKLELDDACALALLGTAEQLRERDDEEPGASHSQKVSIH